MDISNGRVLAAAAAYVLRNAVHHPMRPKVSEAAQTTMQHAGVNLRCRPCIILHTQCSVQRRQLRERQPPGRHRSCQKILQKPRVSMKSRAEARVRCFFAPKSNVQLNPTPILHSDFITVTSYGQAYITLAYTAGRRRARAGHVSHTPLTGTRRGTATAP